MAPKGWKRPTKLASRRPARRLTMPLASAMPQPRDQDRAKQVDDQVHRREDHGTQDDDSLYRRQVAVDHRINRQIAQASITEQPFHNYHAANQKGEPPRTTVRVGRAALRKA